ncbi:acyl-CoA thioester hydrolase/BAAT C-terminal domain-containing protein [Natronococcus sp. A-GB7]|uniref:acyl-CoA thioester hydrolase/BAAT C-terminal domain-containing protein n=1 Tax=Natronococcus sp. A-GB7 TaxID=3037649 RepID=UPI00241E33F2|nr:acyl-CoA thioester hydrolase/BAAT C-terminal domain-containing protein [Natronococcus sp. A-GB7]MDG5821793.1 acyl-CoA thioester hydrolase/BAAT C-terminal domain-containing protein [Natronococcus sp. A-GB7]
MGTSAALVIGGAGCVGEETVDSGTFDHPDEVQADESFELTIDNLPTETPVEVTMESQSGIEASVTVETDADGRIDLARSPIVDGDVPIGFDVPTTVALIQFASGSFWEYQPSEKEQLIYHVETADEDFGSVKLTRSHLDREAYEEPDHEELVGEVFTPRSGDEGPGVLVLHGSEGEPLFDHAIALAQRGFTAFALHYFGGPSLPEDLVEIPLEYVETAAQWLLDHKRVSTDQIGALGVSKGAELGLLAGTWIDEIGPVVSIVGSGLVWEGGETIDDPPGTSSWSINGEPVPYVPYDTDAFEDGISGRELFAESLEAASTEMIEDATIALEEIDGDVLLVSADDDWLWPTTRLHQIAIDQFETTDDLPIEHLRYENAGHGIFPPYRPLSGLEDEFGGSLVGNARAAHDHWPSVLETLWTLD